jgi:hypothetical protein
MPSNARACADQRCVNQRIHADVAWAEPVFVACKLDMAMVQGDQGAEF